MKLVTVVAQFAAESIPEVRSICERDVTKIRALPGCLNYSHFMDTSRGQLLILQNWENMERFDAYRSSDLFAQIGQSLKPLMTTPPETSVYEAHATI